MTETAYQSFLAETEKIAALATTFSGTMMKKLPTAGTFGKLKFQPKKNPAQIALPSQKPGPVSSANTSLTTLAPTRRSL